MLKNKYIEKIINKVLDNPQRLILPETDDSRIKKAKQKMINIGFNILDLDDFKDHTLYINHIKNKKFTQNWTAKMLDEYILNPLNKALIVLDLGDADCLVAGASTSTSEVIKRSIRIVGVDPKSKWISSSFFLTSADGDRSYTYADCGVIPDPDSEQLASIAYEASNIHKLISGDDPKVAFLSFSTKGSAQHYTVKKIQKAMTLFSKRHPNILYEGELQFDAAINKDISKIKVKNSILKGDANTFIFPDLNSANIAYKMSQHLAGFNAWGPLLQGFRKPIHDLSRGCSIDDIICVSAIAAMQSLKNKIKNSI